MQEKHSAVVGEEAETLTSNNPGTGTKERYNSSGHSGVGEAHGCISEEKLKKNCTFVHRLGVHRLLLISTVCNIMFVIIVLGMLVTKSSSGPCPATTVLSCSSGWVGYEDRCYYFSDAEETWNFSQSNCSLYGASLATIDTQKEKDFIMRYKGPRNHWFGLWREKEDQPWKWTNGSLFNNWFKIGANGFCAYLDDDSAISTWCTTKRNWICSKSLSSSSDKSTATKRSVVWG